MMSLNLSKDEATEYIDGLSKQFGTQKVYIGCENSPKNVTLTGDKTQLAWLGSIFMKTSVTHQILRVNVAYHSYFMKDIARAYRQKLSCSEKIELQQTPITMISTVSGSEITNQEIRQDDYWIHNMISPVHFSRALSQLCSPSRRKIQRKKLGPTARRLLRITDILEVGPHSALRGPIRDILASRSGTSASINYFPTVVRKASPVANILDAVGQLWSLGYPVDLLAANMISATRQTLMTDLPQYPFEHSHSHWVESRISSGYRYREFPRHDLLGTPNSDWDPFAPQWRNIINLKHSPWIGDHKVSAHHV